MTNCERNCIFKNALEDILLTERLLLGQQWIAQWMMVSE